jgi:cell division protein FtsB
VDQPVNRGIPNSDEPVRVSGAETEQQPFFEHLVDFFRRNALYFLIAGLILLIVQDIFGTHGVVAMRRSQVEANQIRQEIKQLDDENKRLDGNVKDLNSDPATIEGQARMDGLKRPGEVVFQIQTKQSDAATPTRPKSSVTKN